MNNRLGIIYTHGENDILYYALEDAENEVERLEEEIKALKKNLKSYKKVVENIERNIKENEGRHNE